MDSQMEFNVNKEELIVLIQVLVNNDIEDISILDDRGGSGGWVVTAKNYSVESNNG